LLQPQSVAPTPIPCSSPGWVFYFLRVTLHEIISGVYYTQRGHKLSGSSFFPKKIEPEKLFNEEIGNKKPLPAPYLKV